MAVAIRQAATPDFLLTQWRSQGWSQIQSQVLSQVPVSTTTGRVLIATQLDAFEWQDVSLFGVNLTGDAIARFRDQIRAGGSELHAYALFKRTTVDFLGVKITNYRLLLYHSIVQLGVWAVVILVAAFAALLYLQYISTGQPPVQAIQSLWGGIVKPVQEGASGIVGSAASSISGVYILGIFLAGAVAIAAGRAGQATGTKVTVPKGPSGSVGVRAGGASARIST